MTTALLAGCVASLIAVIAGYPMTAFLRAGQSFGSALRNLLD